MNLPKEFSDHPSLVGILRVPECSYSVTDIKIPMVFKDDVGKFMSVRYVVQVANDITPVDKISSSYVVPKNKITDFYPYTYYVLTDNESEPLIMLPQYLPGSFTVKGKFALSHTPIERYYPSSYKGDTSGNVYNITNTSIMMLPYANNRGVEYMTNNANMVKTSRENSIISTILGGVSAVGSAIGSIALGSPLALGQSLLGGVTGAVNGFLNITSSDARNKDLLLTPSSISSYGTPSSRDTFNTNKVRILKYTVDDKVKSKIENFTDRYGNKYMNYGVIDLKTYKGFIKILEPKINSSISEFYKLEIKRIFERGVKIE